MPHTSNWHHLHLAPKPFPLIIPQPPLTRSPPLLVHTDTRPCSTTPSSRRRSARGVSAPCRVHTQRLSRRGAAACWVHAGRGPCGIHGARRLAGGSTAGVLRIGDFEEATWKKQTKPMNDIALNPDWFLEILIIPYSNPNITGQYNAPNIQQRTRVWVTALWPGSCIWKIFFLPIHLYIHMYIYLWNYRVVVLSRKNFGIMSLCQFMGAKKIANQQTMADRILGLQRMKGGDQEDWNFLVFFSSPKWRNPKSQTPGTLHHIDHQRNLVILKSSDVCCMLARIFVEKKDTASIYQLNLDETLLNLNSDHFGTSQGFPTEKSL